MRGSNCSVTVPSARFAASNDRQHDFGYPCFMPREITIDGLFIDDRNVTKDYQGPFPYRLTEQVTLRNVTTTSGKTMRTSPDAEFAARVRAVEAK